MAWLRLVKNYWLVLHCTPTVGQEIQSCVYNMQALIDCWLPKSALHFKGSCSNWDVRKSEKRNEKDVFLTACSRESCIPLWMQWIRCRPCYVKISHTLFPKASSPPRCLIPTDTASYKIRHRVNQRGVSLRETIIPLNFITLTHIPSESVVEPSLPMTRYCFPRVNCPLHWRLFANTRTEFSFTRTSLSVRQKIVIRITVGRASLGIKMSV